VKHAIDILLAACWLSGCAAGHLPETTAPDILIANVNVVDVVAGRLLAERDVAVTGGQITGLAPHASGSPAPGVTRVIDGTGKYLIPGLWDMHVHALWAAEALPAFLPLFVSQGVTGVRDMGGSLEFLRAARDSIARGAWYPTLVAPGPILDGPEPVQAGISVAVNDSARGSEVVDSLVDGGADFIKVYTLLPRAAYAGVLAAAQRRNRLVAGHVPADVPPEEAARRGQRSMEHLRDELEPYCTRDTRSRCIPLLEVLKEHRVWQVPTLHALRMKSILDDSTLTQDPRLEYLPPAIRQEWRSIRASRARRDTAYFQEKRARVEQEIWLVGLIFRDQGHILAGTDAGVAFSYPGFSLHDELALLVQAGLTPLEALRAATIEPARYLGMEDSVGTIRVGARADLVLLRENPLSAISATRTIESVILRGRLLDREGRDRLMAGVKDEGEN
jgi:imidazolonepropionase-like amidohydrolase